MKQITNKISLRPVLPEEEKFWRKVFFDSRKEYFSLLNLPENELNLLLEMQFQAQNTDYRQNFPQAENDVILSDGFPVGRVIISNEHNDLHLIDIAVLSEYRNLGIGTEILHWLFDESRRTNLTIRFYVEKENRAFRLYERLGFRVVADVKYTFSNGVERRKPLNHPRNLMIKS